MKRATLVIAGIAIICLSLVLLRQQAQEAPVDPIDATVRDSSKSIEPVQKPGDVALRNAVSAGSHLRSSDLVGKSIATFGRLTDAEEAAFISDIESQVRSIEQKIDAHEGARSDPLAALRSALDAAELVWLKARLERVVEMIKAHDYATFKSNGSRPPEVPEFDRIIHGPVTRVDGEPLDAVLYVSIHDSSLRAPFDHWRSLHREYWSQYVDEFNSLPVEERRRRIALHDEARAQQSKGDAAGRLTPQEIQAATISGPVEIERETPSLRVRR